MNSNTTPACPRDNEGNIVNVTTCCDNDTSENNSITKDKNYIFHEVDKPEKYCCYDIYLTKIWVLENEELKAKAELIVTGYANEQSGVFPSMGCWAQIDPRWGWVNANTKIGSFRVKEGTSKPIYLRADIIEAGVEGEGNWELGSDSGTEDSGDAPIVKFNLTCDSDEVIRTRLNVRGHDVTSKAQKSSVSLEFTAFPVECCS